jgi:hypothetical protein
VTWWLFWGEVVWEWWWPVVVRCSRCGLWSVGAVGEVFFDSEERGVLAGAACWR